MMPCLCKECGRPGKLSHVTRVAGQLLVAIYYGVRSIRAVQSIMARYLVVLLGGWSRAGPTGYGVTAEGKQTSFLRRRIPCKAFSYYLHNTGK